MVHNTHAQEQKPHDDKEDNHIGIWNPYKYLSLLYLLSLPVIPSPTAHRYSSLKDQHQDQDETAGQFNSCLFLYISCATRTRVFSRYVPSPSATKSVQLLAFSLDPEDDVLYPYQASQQFSDIKDISHLALQPSLRSTPPRPRSSPKRGVHQASSSFSPTHKRVELCCCTPCVSFAIALNLTTSSFRILQATESESFPDDRSDTGLAFNFATAALSVSESVSTVSSSDDILSSSYRGGGGDCGDCGVFDSPHIMTTTATTDPIDPIDSADSTDIDPIHHTSHTSTPAPPPTLSLTKRQPPPPPPPPPRRYKGQLRYHVWFSNDPYSAEPETFTRLSPMGARLPPRVWEEVQMRIHANARGMLTTSLVENAGVDTLISEQGITWYYIDSFGNAGERQMGSKVSNVPELVRLNQLRLPTMPPEQANERSTSDIESATSLESSVTSQAVLRTPATTHAKTPAGSTRLSENKVERVNSPGVEGGLGMAAGEDANSIDSPPGPNMANVGLSAGAAAPNHGPTRLHFYNQCMFMISEAIIISLGIILLVLLFPGFTAILQDVFNNSDLAVSVVPINNSSDTGFNLTIQGSVRVFPACLGYVSKRLSGLF
ncbi:hypothetical protein F5880DRAFT_1608006 [Lentinula raphanica]|nr:hypothetical protein F5880DRAFT_1608006 [Lentinula raphanica]